MKEVLLYVLLLAAIVGTGYGQDVCATARKLDI